jgi:hypothetical protein
MTKKELAKEKEKLQGIVRRLIKRKGAEILYHGDWFYYLKHYTINIYAPENSKVFSIRAYQVEGDTTNWDWDKSINLGRIDAWLLK